MHSLASALVVQEGVKVLPSPIPRYYSLPLCHLILLFFWHRPLIELIWATVSGQVGCFSRWPCHSLVEQCVFGDACLVTCRVCFNETQNFILPSFLASRRMAWCRALLCLLHLCELSRQVAWKVMEQAEFHCTADSLSESSSDQNLQFLFWNLWNGFQGEKNTQSWFISFLFDHMCFPVLFEVGGRWRKKCHNGLNVK